MMVSFIELHANAHATSEFLVLVVRLVLAESRDNRLE